MRTCYKCGAEFIGHNKVRVCEDCRQSRRYNEYRRKDKGTPLTSREKQLVPKIAEGKGNKQIAYELHIAEGTVKIYLSLIYAKLGLSNRTQLAMLSISDPAAISGIITP